MLQAICDICGKPMEAQKHIHVDVRPADLLKPKEFFMAKDVCENCYSHRLYDLKKALAPMEESASNG